MHLSFRSSRPVAPRGEGQEVEGRYRCRASLEVARHLEGSPQGAAVHTEARGRRHRPVHRQRRRQLRQLARGKSVVSTRSNQSTDPQLHFRPERRRSRRCSGISTPEIRQTGILQFVRVPPLVRRRRPGQSHTRHCLCCSPRMTVEDRCVLRPTHERCVEIISRPILQARTA